MIIEAKFQLWIKGSTCEFALEMGTLIFSKMVLQTKNEQGIEIEIPIMRSSTNKDRKRPLAERRHNIDGSL